MQVIEPKNAKPFHGHDGELITVALLDTPTKGMEFTIQDGTDEFCARLGSEETDQLADFLATSYDPLLDNQYVKFTGQNGEILTIRHSNRGEPYQEIVQICVESQSLDLYVELSTHEASRMKRFINTHPKYQSGS